MSRDHDSGSGSDVPGSEGGSLLGDPLSDVLRTVRLTGALFFLWDVSAPHVTSVPRGSSFAPLLLPEAQQIMSYHIVLEGSVWGKVPGREPTRLESGDVLLIPRGDPYVMASSEVGCSEARASDADMEFFRSMSSPGRPFVVKEGGGGEASLVACGFLGCDDAPFNPVVQDLPALVRLPASADPMRARLRSLIDLALEESRSPGPGSHIVLLRLSELMFVEVVRRSVTELALCEVGWFAALNDQVVGSALRCLHQRPEHHWTLEGLASAVGISRSQLAERFARTVGEPPMQYLTRWRMQLAARLLGDGADKVATVAQGVGYGSEAAFSRAFKRVVGVAPSDWRRRSE